MYSYERDAWPQLWICQVGVKENFVLICLLLIASANNIGMFKIRH